MMHQKTPRRSDCPINFGLEIFGDRWSLLIIRDLMFKGKRYYGEFLAGEEKISTNILADRLKLLSQAGVIAGRKDPGNLTKIIYSLTPKGVALLPMLIELIVWSKKYDPDSAASEAFVEEALTDREALITRIHEQLVPGTSRA